MPNKELIIHFTYHDIDEFIAELKRREVDTLFRGRHHKRIHYRGITEDCSRMFSFYEDMPGFSSDSYYHSSSWNVDDNGYAVYETQDRRTLHDELARLKVNADQLSTFRRRKAESLTKSMTVSSSQESTEDQDVTEKTVKKAAQKLEVSFERHEDKPVILQVTLDDKRYGEPGMKYKLKIAPLDESEVGKLDEMLKANDIKLVKGSVGIERF